MSRCPSSGDSPSESSVPWRRMRWRVVVLGTCAVAGAAWMWRATSVATQATSLALSPVEAGRPETEPVTMVVPEPTPLGRDTRVEHAIVSSDAVSSPSSPKSEGLASADVVRVVVLATDEFGAPLPLFRLAIPLEERRGIKLVGRTIENDADASYWGVSGELTLHFQLTRGDTWSGGALVCALGRLPASVQLDLVAGAEWTGQCALPSVPPNIFGVVRDAGGRPAARIVLQASADSTELYGPLSGTESEVAVTDESGAFAFRVVRKEAARLVVVDGERATRLVLHRRDLGPDMDVRLPASARLSGRLADVGGRAVVPARVQLRSLDAEATGWRVPALMVEDGNFVFEAAPTGELELGVWRLVGPGHWSLAIAVPLTLASGETRTLDVEVPEFP